MRPTRLTLACGMAIAACGIAQAQVADQSRAYSNELLAEAGARESFAADSTVEVGGTIIFRYDLNSRDDAGLEDDTATGFQTRTTELHVTGTVGEDFSYRVQGNFDLDGGVFTLEDAYAVYTANENWAVGMGQVYFPVLWEEHVAYQRGSLAAEPSAFESAFMVNRVQGVWGQYSSEKFRAWIAFDDGAATVNSDFTSAAEADFAFTGRGEFKFKGDWSKFNDFTSFRGSDQSVKLGAAAHFQTGGDTAGTADMDVWLFTADLQWEGNGWNAFGAFASRTIEPTGGTSLDDLGLVLQGGFFFTDNWEGFLRYDAVFADDDRGPSTDDFNTITLGVNNYIIPESQAAKFTVDLQWFLDEQDTSIVAPSTALGLLSSSESDQFNLRFQFQLLF